MLLIQLRFDFQISKMKMCQSCVSISDVRKHKFNVFYNFYFKMFAYICIDGYEAENVSYSEFHNSHPSVPTYQVCKNFVESRESGIRPLRHGTKSETNMLTSRLFYILERHSHLENSIKIRKGKENNKVEEQPNDIVVSMETTLSIEATETVTKKRKRKTSLEKLLEHSEFTTTGLGKKFKKMRGVE